jgi:hydroxypyruvate reductase
VVRRLERGARGETDETPKPGDLRLADTSWQLIGSRFDAMSGAAAEARRRGYDVHVVDAPVVGEARVAGRAYVDRLLGFQPGSALCVISSGETTVRVRGTGRGGRNQELAAAVAERLPELKATITFASCGTDGVDGPTDAAGAIVDSTTLARASAAGLAPRLFLTTNDTYRFFAPLGDLIRTGPTGTNVGDLQVCLLT